MTTVLNTRTQISNWVYLSRMFQLALEMKTGLKAFRQPILKILKYEGILEDELRGTYKNKHLVLQAMVNNYKKTNPQWVIPATIQAALDKTP